MSAKPIQWGQPPLRPGYRWPTVQEQLDTQTALVKCGSHRARKKMLALVGDDDAQALYSLHRETGKGVYRIPAELAPAAKQITGVSGYRDGPDLMRCWGS